MQLDAKIAEKIVNRVLGVTSPDRIIVFGSSATDQMTPDSDIDLLVLVGAPVDAREMSVRIGDALRGLGFSFDIIVMATERFEEMKEVIGGIAYPAHVSGKVIYEAA